MNINRFPFVNRTRIIYQKCVNRFVGVLKSA